MIRLVIFLIVLLIFVSPVLLFIKFLQKKGAKQKKSSWEGTVADKKHLEYEDDDSAYTKDLYTLYFKTNDGETVKLNVSQKVFDSWKVGDKAGKSEGVLLPEKVK